MRSQTPRHGGHGFQVYIFQADASKIKANRSTTWSLFGLWTHSSSPVIQYVCEAGRGGNGVEKKFGIEFLGQCFDASDRNGGYKRRTPEGRTLNLYNHGSYLEPELIEGRTLAPIKNGSIRELPQESPFKLLQDKSTRENVGASRNRRAQEIETHSRRPHEARDVKEECHTNQNQWYSTSAGSEKLRSIQEHCRNSFSRGDKVEINRDTSTHNIQLSIEHDGKTFFVDFPSDFPGTQARVSYSNVYNPGEALQRNDAVKSEGDVVAVIKKYCSCYRCR